MHKEKRIANSKKAKERYLRRYNQDTIMMNDFCFGTCSPEDDYPIEKRKKMKSLRDDKRGYKSDHVLYPYKTAPRGQTKKDLIEFGSHYKTHLRNHCNF